VLNLAHVRHSCDRPRAWSGIARGAAGTVQCEFRRADAAQKRLAVISQSGAIVAGMIEWVAQRILAKW
jgi:sigma54-dependent transcription regulator